METHVKKMMENRENERDARSQGASKRGVHKTPIERGCDCIQFRFYRTVSWYARPYHEPGKIFGNFLKNGSPHFLSSREVNFDASSGKTPSNWKTLVDVDGAFEKYSETENQAKNKLKNQAAGTGVLIRGINGYIDYAGKKHSDVQKKFNRDDCSTASEILAVIDGLRMLLSLIGSQLAAPIVIRTDCQSVVTNTEKVFNVGPHKIQSDKDMEYYTVICNLLRKCPSDTWFIWTKGRRDEGPHLVAKSMIQNSHWHSVHWMNIFCMKHYGFKPFWNKKMVDSAVYYMLNLYSLYLRVSRTLNEEYVRKLKLECFFLVNIKAYGTAISQNVGFVSQLHIREAGMAGRALLLAGLPGIGKTVLALGISQELVGKVSFCFCPMVGSELLTSEVKKTEVLIENIRRAVGLRIKENKEVYEGEHVTLHDLDAANARPQGGQDNLSLIVQMMKPRETEITDKLRQEIDKVLNRYIDEGIDEVHMLDVECFSFLNRVLESALCPIVIIATNRGIFDFRRTTVNRIPYDLRTTYTYGLADMIQILAIIAQQEELMLEREGLAYLGKIAQRASLRHAVQLLSLASVIGRMNGRENICKADIEEVAAIYVNALKARLYP